MLGYLALVRRCVPFPNVFASLARCATGISAALIAGMMANSAAAFEAPPSQSFANCAALNGADLLYLVSTLDESPSAVTVLTIEQLLDTDLVTVSYQAVSDGGSSSADNVTISAGGSEIFSGFLGTPSANTQIGSSFDPAGDSTDVAIVFAHSFLPFPAEWKFSVECTPQAGEVDETNSGVDPDEEARAEEAARIVQTQGVTQLYINERVNRFLEETPDRPRLLRKRLTALWESRGGISEDEIAVGAAHSLEAPVPAPLPADVRGAGIARGITGFGFSGMPGSAWRAHFSLRDLAQDMTYGADIITEAPPEAPEPPPFLAGSCWDLWAEGHYSIMSGAGGRSGEYMVAYAGLDCQIHDSAIAGFLGQFDWISDEISEVDSQIEGEGWMIGPYATIRLTQDLFLDVRGAWGQSSNRISIAGVEGEFDTERWLLHGRLSGNYRHGDFRITPEVDVAYGREDSQSYLDSQGAFIDGQSGDIGRLRFGPEIAWRHDIGDGVHVEPHFSLKGVWDFIEADSVALDGVVHSYGGLRGLAEIGLLIRRADNASLRINAKYDGIGVDDYRVLGAQVWLSIPL